MLGINCTKPIVADIKKNTVPWERTYQYALVHVAIVAELHADPDDAGVVHLSVVEGQGGHRE